MGRGRPGVIVELCLVGEQRWEQRIARGPAAGRRQGDDGIGPTAGGDLEGDMAAERVADDAGRLEAGVR